MTTTQSEIVATNCVVMLDNAANVLTDISGSSNKVAVKFENSIAEWHTFSTQWKSRRVVHKDGPITINAIYTTLSTEAAQLVGNWFHGGNDSPRSLMLYVPDSQVGAFTITGEYVLASYSYDLDADADDVVRVQLELLPDGSVTRATNAT